MQIYVYINQVIPESIVVYFKMLPDKIKEAVKSVSKEILTDNNLLQIKIVNEILFISLI